MSLGSSAGQATLEGARQAAAEAIALAIEGIAQAGSGDRVEYVNVGGRDRRRGR
jgi:hypothetical protein